VEPRRPGDERAEERRRLARELHDGPAQALAAALFGVDLAVAALERRPETARAELRHAREHVREALDDVRQLISGLRPRLLEERGLMVAMQALGGAPGLWGPVVSVETGGLTADDRLPPEIELALYRIAQEAVSNARSHGAASRVAVTIETRPGAVRLTIADDGRGFDRDQSVGAPGRGEGIAGMIERAEALGGRLQIASVPGEGTRIDVTLPLPAA
jgi:signal transduction histidine kinase